MREDRDREKLLSTWITCQCWNLDIFIYFYFYLAGFSLFFGFALCEFIDYCKQYLTMYLTGLDWTGWERE